MGEYGWRSLFWIGGIAPIVIASILPSRSRSRSRFLAFVPAAPQRAGWLLKKLRSDLVIDSDTEFVISGEEKLSAFFDAGVAHRPARGTYALLLDFEFYRRDESLFP